MRRNPDMGNKMRRYLQELDPLQILTLQDLYRELAEAEEDKPQVRYQLYRHSLGSPVVLHSPPQEFYAIQMSIPDNQGRIWRAFLSLPVIDRDELIREIIGSEVETIIAQLGLHYGGAFAVHYWMGAAQRRSVDLIRHEMDEAKARSQGECVICREMQLRGYSIADPHRGFHAAHIISRRTVFWRTLYQLNQEGYNLFTDQGVEVLQDAIEANKYHSTSQYMLGLCRKHDQVIQQQIEVSIEQLQDRLESAAVKL